MASENKNSPLLYLQLFAGMALFGSATPLSKIVGEGFPVFTASLMRMGLAALVLAPFVIPRLGELKKASASDWRAMAFIALFGMVGFTATMLFGMRLASGVVGATVMSMTPAVTALAAFLFLKESYNATKSTALALAVAGAITINIFNGGSGESGMAMVWGSLLVFAAVCFEAGYTLLAKTVSDALSALSISFAASVMAIPVFLLLALLFDPDGLTVSGANTGHWAALAFWGAITAGLAPVIWYTGVRQAPGALAAGFMAVMPVSALVGSYLLLDESFRGAHLAGFGLVFAGVLLMVREHMQGMKED
ncbi:membrane protein [Aquisalinus flavus]|uniref:Membrane protein n=1 Tax=Aquisalinus flavus TaxID=1526572 RepID=A0A8J2V7X5_9PROT|nr:DMT family transporter [Aquisalinus flavus]MBD0428036.1 DMT family transporter [Aquisalinus flavus]GGD19182.1 membrane protein [Aquisalinus flavus]